MARRVVRHAVHSETKLDPTSIESNDSLSMCFVYILVLVHTHMKRYTHVHAGIEMSRVKLRVCVRESDAISMNEVEGLGGIVGYRLIYI